MHYARIALPLAFDAHPSDLISRTSVNSAVLPSDYTHPVLVEAEAMTSSECAGRVRCKCSSLSSETFQGYAQMAQIDDRSVFVIQTIVRALDSDIHLLNIDTQS